MDIPGFSRYTIDENCEIIDKETGKTKNIYNHSAGYKFARLQNDNNIDKFPLIHRLMAFAYLDNPHNYEYVDHINRNKHMNNISNLRWVTPSENNINRVLASPKSGVKNIIIRGNKYNFEILRNGTKYRKSYNTLSQACCGKFIFIHLRNQIHH
tara:strand:+ start:894 stop:1355 length:462 start_codon:yes stop_codon:yes gene_type:complete